MFILAQSQPREYFTQSAPEQCEALEWDGDAGSPLVSELIIPSMLVKYTSHSRDRCGELTPLFLSVFYFTVRLLIY